MVLTGDLVPLDQQDKTRWDEAALLAEGVALISVALPRGLAIRALSAPGGDRRPAPRGTHQRCHRLGADLITLNTACRGLSDNPMVNLNHAIATAIVDGPAAGLEQLDALGERTRAWPGPPPPGRRARPSPGDGGRRRGGPRLLPAAAAGLTSSLQQQRYLHSRASQAQWRGVRLRLKLGRSDLVDIGKR